MIERADEGGRGLNYLVVTLGRVLKGLRWHMYLSMVWILTAKSPMMERALGSFGHSLTLL